MQNFRGISATSFELSRSKKLTTHRQTQIHTFSGDDFLLNVDHILTKEMVKFDNSILTLNQFFTQPKIEKTIGSKILPENIGLRVISE